MIDSNEVVTILFNCHVILLILYFVYELTKAFYCFIISYSIYLIRESALKKYTKVDVNDIPALVAHC